jgi:predicted cobalt transporter CbtA
MSDAVGLSTKKAAWIAAIAGIVAAVVVSIVIAYLTSPATPP